MKPNKTYVAITGGIASGKSTLARLIKGEGYPVIDADQVARELVEPGSPVLKEIARTFGQSMILADGSLDRKALGQEVFSDPQKRSQLDAIMKSPLIKALQGALDQAPGPLVFLDAALLFEWQLEEWFDWTVLVALPQPLQIERLMQRDGLSEEEALNRMGAQMPLEEKRQRADRVIENDDDLKALKQKALALLEVLTNN